MFRTEKIQVVSDKGFLEYKHNTIMGFKVQVKMNDVNRIFFKEDM